MCDSIDDDAETHPADHGDCTHFLSHRRGWGCGGWGGVSQRRPYNQDHKREGISVLYKVRGKLLPRKEEQSGEIWRR